MPDIVLNTYFNSLKCPKNLLRLCYFFSLTDKKKWMQRAPDRVVANRARVGTVGFCFQSPWSLTIHSLLLWVTSVGRLYTSVGKV